MGDHDSILRDINLFNFAEGRNDTLTKFDQLELLKSKYIGPHNLITSETKISSYLNQRYPSIYNILVLGEGKISLCGYALHCILSNNNIDVDIDLFFHSCSEAEAEKLLIQSLSLISKHSTRSSKSVIVSGHKNRTIFHTRIYASKEDVLLDFDMLICKRGWNPVDNYFSTISADLSYATGLLPLDINLHYKDGFIRCGKNYNLYITHPDSSYEEIFLSETNVGSKFYTHKDNIIAINEGREDDVVFKDFPTKSIQDLSDDYIRQYFLPIKYHAQSEKIPKIKFFLGNNAGDYFRALADNSQDQCDTIWNNQLNYYLDSACNIGAKIRNRPMFQKSISKERISNPHISNIFYDRFLIFYYALLSYNYPKEIIKILCDYWMEVEIFAAQKRLFGSVSKIEPQTASPQQINVVPFDIANGLYRTCDYDFMILANEHKTVVIGRYSDEHQCIIQLTDQEKIVANNMGLMVETI